MAKKSVELNVDLMRMIIHIGLLITMGILGILAITDLIACISRRLTEPYNFIYYIVVIIVLVIIDISVRRYIERNYPEF